MLVQITPISHGLFNHHSTAANISQSYATGSLFLDPEITTKHHYVASCSKRPGLSATVVDLVIEVFALDSSDLTTNTIEHAIRHFIKICKKSFPYSPLIFLNEMSYRLPISDALQRIYGPKESAAYHAHTSPYLGTYSWPASRNYIRIIPPGASRRRAFFIKTYHYPF